MAFVFENTAPRFELEDSSKERFIFEEEDKPSTISNVAKGAMETAKDIGLVYPALETAANLVTMTYGLPASGLAALASLPFKGVGGAAKIQEQVAEKLIYQPQTKRGEALTETAFYPILELEEEVASPVGKAVAEKYGPTAGAIAHTGIMGAPLAIPFIGKALRKKGAVVKPTKPFKPEGPETKFIKQEFKERFILEEAKPQEPPVPKFVAPEPILKAKYNKVGIKPTLKSETLYSGIPINKAGKIWTKNIGEPIWDKAVMKGIPKLLEKIPGGKTINRALLYDYRGDLPNTAKYIASMEDMKRSQSIGREYAVDLGNRLQSVPEASQLKMGEYITTKEPTVKLSPQELKLAKEAKFAMLDLGKQAVDAGLLSEKTFFENAGRYMPRLYTSKEYQSLLTRFNVAKPNRLDLSRFKQRKDIPKEIRQDMGEILTPGYPIAKGITQLTHDIELARFFNGVASNKGWAIIKQPKISKKTGKPIGYKRTTYDPLTGKPIEHFGIKKEFTDKIPEGWKQLSSNKKLGNLSESYVHPEIFADLQEFVRIIEAPEKFWRKSLGAWKFGKVIISPKTHARNLMSNSVLAHLGGMPMYEQPIYLTKAAMEMRKKGEYWKAIKQEGGNQHTFTAGELNALFDQVEGQLKGIKAGSIPEKMGVIGNSWSLLKKGGKKAADLYQAEEQWFKTAKFIHNIERKKMTPKAAWKDAEKWLFNYSKVTKFQEKYRSRWYGAPFATFTFKALPRIAEAAIKTPWRFALPGAMIYGLEEWARKEIGDTREQAKAKKALRHEWMKGQSLGIPNFARVPIIDDQGREYYLNLTYILPWGDIGEAGNFGPIPGGIMPLSQPFVKEPMSQILNYDSFWEQPIVQEKDIAGMSKADKFKTKAKIRGKHLANTMLPTLVIDVTKAVAALRGIPDYKGRLKPPKVVAADVIAGVKMYPVDYVEQVARQIGKIDPQKGWLARKIHTDIRTLAIKKRSLEKRGKDTTLYDKQIEMKIQQLKGLATESVEIGKLYKQLR